MNRKTLSKQITASHTRLKKLVERGHQLTTEHVSVTGKIASEMTNLKSLETTLAAAPPEVVYDRAAIIARVDELRRQDIPYSVIADTLNREGQFSPKSAPSFSQATIYQMHTFKDQPRTKRKKDASAATPPVEAALHTPAETDSIPAQA